MAIVVNLDPFRRARQAENARRAFQQRRLSRAFRHAPFKGFPRIGGGVFQGFVFFAALGPTQFHAPPGLDRQSLRNQRRFGWVMR